MKAFIYGFLGSPVWLFLIAMAINHPGGALVVLGLLAAAGAAYYHWIGWQAAQQVERNRRANKNRPIDPLPTGGPHHRALRRRR